jgi:hypothetical protein
MLIGLALWAVIVILLVVKLVAILVLVLSPVFLGTFPCFQGHVLFLLLQLAVLLVDIGLVVLHGNLVEMHRVQNPTVE